MEVPGIHQESPAWIAYVHISFVLSIMLMCIGIWVLPVTLWIKGYLAMGMFFAVSSSLSLSKTLRDQHEARKLINRVSTAKMLKEFDLNA
jgi:hypothetical protein